jgi:hypothetical protein
VGDFNLPGIDWEERIAVWGKQTPIPDSLRGGRIGPDSQFSYLGDGQCPGLAINKYA